MKITISNGIILDNNNLVNSDKWNRVTTLFECGEVVQIIYLDDGTPVKRTYPSKSEKNLIDIYAYDDSYD